MARDLLAIAYMVMSLRKSVEILALVLCVWIFCTCIHTHLGNIYFLTMILATGS